MLGSTATASPLPRAAETAVKGLYDTLTEEQRKAICFDWDYVEKGRGLLRTFVSNNWQITPQAVVNKQGAQFYTKKQQDIVHDIFKGLINPDWYTKFMKQLKDDNGGDPWGTHQSIAIFGKPGQDKFEFVITGRHQTLRADGNSEAHVAFGGPIFYGHAAQGFNEKPDHPGNVWWHQARRRTRYTRCSTTSSGKSCWRNRRRIKEFKGPTASLGLAITEMSDDQKSKCKSAGVADQPFRKKTPTQPWICQ